MRRILTLGVAVVLIWLGCITNAHAVTMMYTDLSAWQTAVLASGCSTTNIDFENATVSGANNTVTADGVVFASPGMPLELRDYGTPYNSGMVLYPASNQQIQVILPSGVYAFGFDLGEVGGLINLPPPTLSNVQLSTGEIFTGPYVGNPYPTYAFFGFVSTDQIISLSLKPYGIIEPIIDNFIYGQGPPPPVPEPSSLILLSVGIFCIMGYGWRNHC